MLHRETASLRLSSLLFSLFNMRFTTLAVIFAITSATRAAVASPVPADSSITQSSVVRLPLIRRQHPSSRLRKRADSFSAQLYNEQGSEYLVKVAIGTPPQEFTVTLDTGR